MCKVFGEMKQGQGRFRIASVKTVAAHPRKILLTRTKELFSVWLFGISPVCNWLLRPLADPDILGSLIKFFIVRKPASSSATNVFYLFLVLFFPVSLLSSNPRVSNTDS